MVGSGVVRANMEFALQAGRCQEGDGEMTVATGFEEVTIGDCRLILGDCREVLPTLPQVDLVLTDPPYGIGYAAQPTKWSRDNVAREPEEWDDELPDIMPIVEQSRRLLDEKYNLDA